MADLLGILHLSLTGMGLTHSSPSLSFLPLPNSASGKREIRNLTNFAEELNEMKTEETLGCGDYLIPFAFPIL